jgi:hypothetical protein
MLLLLRWRRPKHQLGACCENTTRRSEIQSSEAGQRFVWSDDIKLQDNEPR